MGLTHHLGKFVLYSLLGFVFYESAASSIASPATIAAIDYWQFPASSCPPPCADFGIDPATWPLYHDANAQVRNCNETYLFQTNIYITVDTGQNVHYRACTGAPASTVAKRQLLAFNSSEPTEVPATIHLASWTSSSGNVPQASVSEAVSQLSKLQQSSANTGKSKAFLARSGNVVAGMFVGIEIAASSVASITDAFLEYASSGLASQQAAQVCDISSTLSTASQIFGIVIDTTGDITKVQSALASWNNATCVSGSESNSALRQISLHLILGDELSIVPSGSVPVERRTLVERATCKYLEVESGDSCSSLASSCGIPLSTFESCNSGINCNDLQLNTYVCCSPGTPLNFAPQPYSNGTCYTYAVASGDYCYAIATAHNITIAVIQNSNNNTWGWSGCSDLFVGQTICLSSGNPPYPANVPNSVCGPQVNGTVFSANYTSWAGLNPCPLNACCDIYGQCGIDADFCTPSMSSTGAPGTAAVGSNGCISNCGTEIVASGPPSKFSRIGYFEAFDNQRSCLNMPPSDIPSAYDHVHFAFANTTSSFDVDVSGEADYFQDFLNTDGFNRILSFGGWAFSTDPSTYPIFRSGVTPANQLSFARNVANFIQSHNLPGVDFDWEYPGPSIITGIPSGSPDDGANYLAFLKTLRGILPTTYSTSIRAPASFYYLKNFPIEEMATVVNYIVYMTYDLHGQWDYGNQYTNPGGPAGNCLRSQTNMTETQSAFSMITKAGVPASMIMVGQPLYGRSFQMTTAGCYTEQCTFTGPASGALPGPCTDTAGYISNWEINQIISNSQYKSSVQQ